VITVVGAGIGGLACARTLARAGVPVQVVERTSAVGGRLARADVPPIGRRVEWGAAYLTGYGEPVAELVQSWAAAELLAEWTDTFALAGPDGITGSTTGPMRYRAPAGLRSLARDLARGLPVTYNMPVTSVARDTVLAMPRPQAAAIAPWIPGIAEQPWEAVTVTIAVFPERTWPDFGAAFVNGSDDLALIVDDGARVGDGAPVLVLYEPGRPTSWPDEAPPATGGGLAAATRILDLAAPIWTRTRTWRLAQPAIADDRRYGYDPVTNTAAIGDGWSGKPRIGAALTSGIALAEHLIATR
jgi:renalase